MSSPQRELMIQMTTHNTQRYFDWKTFEMIWAQPPTIDRLNQIQTKTLSIIGTQDMADNLHVAELFKQLPDIHIAYIEAADHMPTLTHPDQVSSLIIKFLSQ